MEISHVLSEPLPSLGSISISCPFSSFLYTTPSFSHFFPFSQFEQLSTIGNVLNYNYVLIYIFIHYGTTLSGNL